MPEDLRDDVVRRADQQRSVRGELRVELGAGRRAPPALLPDRPERARVTGEKVVGRLLRGGRDVAEGVYPDLQPVGSEPGEPARLPLQVDERPEASRLAAA